MLDILLLLLIYIFLLPSFPLSFLLLSVHIFIHPSLILVPLFLLLSSHSLLHETGKQHIIPSLCPMFNMLMQWMIIQFSHLILFSINISTVQESLSCQFLPWQLIPRTTRWSDSSTNKYAGKFRRNTRLAPNTNIVEFVQKSKSKRANVQCKFCCRVDWRSSTLSSVGGQVLR